MRKRTALLLMLTLLVAPALAAAPAVEEGPTTWIGKIVDQVVEFVLGSLDESETRDDELRPAGDPNGPGVDPKGTTSSTDSPPEGENGPSWDPNG